MKQSLIKVKKTSLVIYNEGYVCINGNYLVKADLVLLDDTFLQHQIDEKKPFAYQVDSRAFREPPQMLPLIPKASEGDYLDDTLLIKECRRVKQRLFYNPAKKYITAFNNTYLSIMENVSTLKLKQTGKLNAAAMYDGNNECLFLVMPIQLRDEFISKIENALNTNED